jgi:hypothetical protein
MLKNRIIPVNNKISRHTLKHTTEYSGLKPLVASQWQDCYKPINEGR